MSMALTAATVEPLDGFPSPTGHAELAPVVIELERRCHFKAKTCGACGKPRSNAIHRQKNVGEGKPFCAFKRRNGCANCGQAKKDRGHLGAPPSMNVWGRSGDGFAYLNMKDQWQEALSELLAESPLPRGLAGVMVEGEATFPDRGERDQGNHRGLLEKALGDALEAGGWIDRDDWESYEFGNLAYRHEPGVSRTRLILFPRGRA